MADDTNSGYAHYLTTIGPGWLRGVWGQRLMKSIGRMMDGQTDLMRQAVKARTPDAAVAQGMSDALDKIGDDRLLPRGGSAPNVVDETDASYAARLKVAWTTWGQDNDSDATHPGDGAGTPGGLLRQLGVLGFPLGIDGTILVNHLGIWYAIDGSGELVWGDCMPCISRTDLHGQIPTDPATHEPAPLKGFTLDARDQFYSRFVIIFGQDVPSLTNDAAGSVAVARLNSTVKNWKSASAIYMGATVIPAVTVADSVYLATGSLGDNPNGILYSANGIAWTPASITVPPDKGIPEGWYFNGSTIAFANGLYLVVAGYLGPGVTDGYARSTDGVSWTMDRLEQIDGPGVIYGDSDIWLMGGAAGATNSIASSTDGIAWTGRGATLDVVNAFARIVGTAFVAVGSSVTAGSVAHSADGHSWSLGTGLDPAVRLWTVAQNGSVFLAGGDGADHYVPFLATSTDGASWTSVTLPSILTPADCYIDAIAWVNGKWWLAYQDGTGGDDHLAWSTDLATWTDIGTVGLPLINSLSGAGTLFEVSGYNTDGPAVVYSNDSGATWHAGTGASNYNLRGVFGAHRGHITGVWGWPVTQKWGDAGRTWGDTASRFIPPG